MIGLESGGINESVWLTMVAGSFIGGPSVAVTRHINLVERERQRERDSASKTTLGVWKCSLSTFLCFLFGKN